MALPLISEVLHLAADKYLAIDYNDYFYNCHKEKYSCCAVEEAIWELVGLDSTYKTYCDFKNRVFHGLDNMGCDTDCCHLFNDFEKKSDGYVCAYIATKKSQEARYFWLKWAALMAEEQGV